MFGAGNTVNSMSSIEQLVHPDQTKLVVLGTKRNKAMLFTVSESDEEVANAQSPRELLMASLYDIRSEYLPLDADMDRQIKG